MAFDQTSIPNNLRPLNIVRNVADEPRIVGRAPEGYFPGPALDIGSPDSGPVYYSTVPDPAGYYGVGPTVAPWPPRLAVPAPAFGYNPNSAPQASEEDEDDSKKVKFLCSYRGRILPRPCDGALRYVGGHTRIVSVRRDSSFEELSRKMAEVYGNGQQHVYIKYQLPDEDLDALVSVSCPEDLDNMMDEFKKMNEEAKPRLFLFSPAELDQSGLVRFSDLNDTNGMRYVDAVNGVGDFGGVARMGSVASANSDFSGSEAVEAQGDLGGAFSRKRNSGNSDVGLVGLDHDPVVKSAAPQMESESERSVPVTQQIPAPIHVTQPEYLQQIPPQMGFPGPHLMYAPQFVAATTNPASHNVSAAQQNTRMHGYVDEMAYAPRVYQVPVPVEQSYAQYHQVPVPAASTVTGANYRWHQVPATQHGHAIPATYSNVVPIPECYMCQNALPHAHSDTAAQSPLSDPSSGYNNLRPEDHSRSTPVIRVMVSGGAETQRRGISEAQTPFIVSTAPQPSSSSSVVYDQMRPIEGKMEALKMGPAETSDQFSGSDVATESNSTSRLVEHYEVAQAPLWGSPGLNEVYLPPTPNMIGDVQDLSNSLFSNQDPWNMNQDPQFPPPPRENIFPEPAVPKDPFRENPFANSAELNAVEEGLVQQPLGVLNTKDRDSDQSQLSRGTGTAEEQIRSDLQAVAEGVAASVLQSNTSSNPDLHDKNVVSTESILDESKAEDVKTKLPERAHQGFPVSDGIGRLQIIKNIDLEELRELGSGTFGTVYHGKWRGTDVAIKRINDRCFAGKPSEQERMRDDFWNEAIKLADLHHPNVLAFYGLVLDGPGGSVATVTEYMVNGSLKNSLQKNEKSLDKRKRLLIAMDVAFGMEYLHGKNIVHFDLKSDNLLVNLRDPHRPICKVGDLGLSKVKCQTLISGGVRGTLPWMAPELLNGSSSLVSEKVDVFSFGIVMWELLTGEEPYADLHYGAIIGGIVSNTLRPVVPEFCDPEWKSLMEKCWSAEPYERPSFTEIANHLRSVAAKIPPKPHIATTQPALQS